MFFERLISPVRDVRELSFVAVSLIFMLYVLVRAIVLQGGIYFFTRTEFAQRKRVYRLPYGKGQFASELRATVWNILLDGVFIGAMVQIFPPNPALNNYVTAFLISFVWLEIWFYVSHRLFHTKALYWIHEQHHVAKVVSPFTALSFSVLERLTLLVGGVGVIVLFSRYVLPLAPLGVAMNLVVNYLLNLFAHTNIEVIPPSWLRWGPGRVLNAPTYHAMHHARYKGHYGLYTPFLDWMFNSQFEDYREVQRAAYEGRGLTAMHQRLAAKSEQSLVESQGLRVEA